MLLYALYAILAFFSLLAVVSSSAITTYTDAKCNASFNNLDVINGYPDGVCTPLRIIGNVQAFQIARLDPGCAVTLYGPDETELKCSASLKIVAEFAKCYDSFWVYYSVDGCLPPVSSSIILPTATPTPTPFPTPSALSATPPSPTTTSASASPPPAPLTNYTGIVVGGLIAGVAIVAIVFGIIFFCIHRKNRQNKKPLPSSPPSYELSIEHARLEAARASIPEIRSPEKVAPAMLAEMGRNSTYIPPAELPGDAMVEQDKKGINRHVKIHEV
ncbi:hypothetical protein K458DRAFT_430656 [Lentithecium fluviatile CBS 122367]|uniref:Mid2 domain-containing protein n=1 Tax=Lentithecium fluviatile CBS 122367 TaxID=1168545 RepID=A0A6G1J3F7_9PLEO|nr:hypothetical protein K458DRAFT_430656 [Lentithecium fluviatile CBS 122367]